MSSADVMLAAPKGPHCLPKLGRVWHDTAIRSFSLNSFFLEGEISVLGRLVDFNLSIAASGGGLVCKRNVVQYMD